MIDTRLCADLLVLNPAPLYAQPGKGGTCKRDGAHQGMSHSYLWLRDGIDPWDGSEKDVTDEDPDSKKAFNISFSFFSALLEALRGSLIIADIQFLESDSE